ncbi:MAG: nitrogenase component 1 [Candidatus Methanoplasma sp.]|jgi:hypothetical protein|nr:nitrogenase component 1 [Candidatus Methanoplasma sp.]
MAQLFMSIPTFATDYSGAASFLSDLGGMIIIHGPTGCVGNFTGYDEPRWFNHPKMVFNSALRQKDAILGDDSVIKNKIAEACKIHGPPFVAILGTPIPDLIGCDLDGIAAEIEEETGVPAFGVNTNGYGFYQDGIDEAYSALERRFPLHNEDIGDRTVNVVGCSPLDYFGRSDNITLREMIASAGRNIGYFQTDDALAGFLSAAKADRNVVVSASAVHIAELMKKKHGIPYDAAVPVGSSGAERLQAFLTGGDRDDAPEGKGRRVLVVGDQVISNSIRDMIAHEFDLGSDVATFFQFHPSLAKNGDTHLRGESELEDILGSDRYDVVIGDPVFEPLIKRQTFIPLPHPATSGRIYRNFQVPIAGTDLVGYLGSRIPRSVL